MLRCPPGIGVCLPVLLFLAAVTTPASAAESLVGTWATPGKCGRPLSTVIVEPLGFSGEDFHCDFTSVARTGDTVRWRGTCTFGVDAEKTGLTARLSGGKLSYRFDKQGWNGPLQRCPR